MNKVAVCIPAWGTQPKDWWGPLLVQFARYHEQGIQIVDVFPVSTMMVDVSRNKIVRLALETEAEWLYWLDTDNTHKAGTLKTLLSTAKDRPMVTGIYVKRDDAQPEPVAYTRLADGRYQTLGSHRRGQIVPLDAAGFGGCLIHRAVFEAIDDNYRALMRASGGIVAIHKDDIRGDIFDEASADTDGKVVDGVLYDRLYIPPAPAPKVPFFALEYGRTEDFAFFEKAKRLGYQLWCDTHVEIGHIMEKTKEPTDFHEWLKVAA